MMNKRLRMPGILIGCLGLLSCTHSDPYFFLNPKMPVTVPFAMDEAGNKASIDFWAVPGKVRLANKYGEYQVRLDFSRKDTQEDLVGFLEDTKNSVAVKLKIFFVGNETETTIVAIDVPDGRAFNHIPGYPLPSLDKIRHSLAYLHLTCWDADTISVEVVGFELPEYGHYRVDVETPKDQPIFKNVKSSLIVSEPICLAH